MLSVATNNCLRHHNRMIDAGYLVAPALGGLARCSRPVVIDRRPMAQNLLASYLLDCRLNLFG